jgi:hypothetical protein
MKACCFCGSPATLSVCTIVSSLGMKPRLQENTEAVPLCRACLDVPQTWDGLAGQPGLKQRVNTAADALTKHAIEQSQPIFADVRVSEENTEARGSAPASLSLPIRD